ncbi:MAG: hypothetical protein M0P31_03010 [Solirubrobacteraceae bacterium]|nr:hypothetical protein [Solirubrobacteraceae bacterium]
MARSRRTWGRRTTAVGAAIALAAGMSSPTAATSSEPVPAAPAATPDPGADPVARLAGALQRSVTDVERTRFGARDDQGRQLAGLDVVPDPDGHGYLGVYFWPTGPGPADYAVSLGESDDLLTWRRIIDLDVDGGNMPVIHRLPGDAGFLVAFEDYREIVAARTARSNLRIRHYPDRSALAANRWAAERIIPRTLSPTNEGTPEITAVNWGRGPRDSVVRIGFHYNARGRGVDRHAEGRLVGFSDWTATPDEATEGRLKAAGFLASHGKRSRFELHGRAWELREAQRVPGDFATWSLLLADPATGQGAPLSLTAPRGRCRRSGCRACRSCRRRSAAARRCSRPATSSGRCSAGRSSPGPGCRAA